MGKQITLTLAWLLLICLIGTIALVSSDEPLDQYHLYISSPKQTIDYTYANTTVDLLLIVWIPTGSPDITSVYYNLDGAGNHTLAGSRRYTNNYYAEGNLVNLTQGTHIVRAYAETNQGVVASAEQSFTVDSTYKYPVLTILSPLNQTYTKNEIPVIFTVNGEVKRAEYSLDFPPAFNITGNFTLSNLTDGPHRVYVYVQTNSGHSSSTTYFYINQENSNAPFPQTFETLIIISAVVLAVVIFFVAIFLNKKAK
jgi:hypothetical protein